MRSLLEKFFFVRMTMTMQISSEKFVAIHVRPKKFQKPFNSNLIMWRTSGEFHLKIWQIKNLVHHYLFGKSWEIVSLKVKNQNILWIYFYFLNLTSSQYNFVPVSNFFDIQRDFKKILSFQVWSKLNECDNISITLKKQNGKTRFEFFHNFWIILS
jgi:hypothetical protein